MHVWSFNSLERKMISGSTGGTGSSLLQRKEDGKFYGRLLSKETSFANPSFRVYYSVAAAGSVPFLWESRPGTPKHAPSDAALPPLTPPPSYFSSPSRARSKSSTKKPGSKYSFSSLPKLLSLKKAATGDGRGGGTASMSPSSSLSFSSSSSSSSSSSPFSDHRRQPSDDDEEAKSSGSRSPTSTLCFGVPIFLVIKKDSSV